MEKATKKIIIISSIVLGLGAIAGTVYYFRVVKPKKPTRDRKITLIGDK
jgi:hypothetical protein